MDTIFMKSKNRKKFDPHRLLFNLSEKKIQKEEINMQYIAYAIHEQI